MEATVHVQGSEGNLWESENQGFSSLCVLGIELMSFGFAVSTC